MNYHHHHNTIINLRPRFPPFFRPGFKSLSPSPCVFLWCCFFHPLVPYLCHQPSCNAVLISQTTSTTTTTTTTTISATNLHVMLFLYLKQPLLLPLLPLLLTTTTTTTTTSTTITTISATNLHVMRFLHLKQPLLLLLFI